jgi:hypothetical protein
MRDNIKTLNQLTLAMGLMACNGLALAGQNSIVVDTYNVVAQDNAQGKVPVKVSGKHIKTDTNKENDTNNATIPVDNSNDTALLGNGYDSQADALKALNTVFVAQQADGLLLGDTDNDGIDDGATRMGNAKATFTVAVDKSFEDTLSLIEGSASVSVNYPKINAQGNVNLALATAASSNVASYTLFARVEPKKAVWLPAESEANEAGSGADLQPTTTLTEWKNVEGTGQPLIDRIGDEFIQATEYGAWLMVNLKFEYHNAEDKNQIGGSLKVDYQGLVTVEGAASWDQLNRSETVKVTFTAQQAGGVSSELVNVVPSTLLSCNLNAPENCLSAFQDAITYMKTNFATQFDNNANYNTIRYYTRRYDESGPTLTSYMGGVTPQERTFGSGLALRQMSTHWLQAKQDQQRADYLLTSQSSYLSTSEVNAITAVKTAAGQNITTLSGKIDTCQVGAADACDIT